MRAGHLALAEVLLTSGAQRNVFTMAATGDAAGLARKLRRAPAEARRTADLQPNGVGVTPLHVACASDWNAQGPGRMTAQVRVAAILQEHGAPIDAAARYRGIDDATPLFCACWSSANVALVRWLLEQGARAADRDLGAALGHFQRHGKESYDIAELLLGWGLGVDGSTPGDRTPLQAFAHMGAHRAVAWLIAHGANVNARGPGGRTAAHFAAERNTGPATLELLADSGADLGARDVDGLSPLGMARLHNKVRLVEWIKRRTRGKSR
jgi:ankyrin repeat protein